MTTPTFNFVDVPEERYAKEWGAWLLERCEAARLLLKNQKELADQTIAAILAAAQPLLAPEHAFLHRSLEQIKHGLDDLSITITNRESKIQRFELLAQQTLRTGNIKDLLGHPVREALKYVDDTLEPLRAELADLEREVYLWQIIEKSDDEIERIIMRCYERQEEIEGRIEKAKNIKIHLVAEAVMPLTLK